MSVRHFLPFGLGLALAGCAVLKIDVDVYKGPLANHEDVQVEQMAVMAVGANPLLTQLRDRLQWPDSSLRNCARNQPWYDHRFFPRPVESLCCPASNCQDASYVEWDERAGRVNNVLSLYEEIGDSVLLQFVNDGRQAFLDLEKASSILYYRKQPIDIELSRLVSGGATPRPEADASTAAQLLELRKSYQRLLTPRLPDREAGLLKREARCIQYMFDQFVRKTSVTECPKFGTPGYERSSLDAYEPLRNEANVRRHANVVIPTAPEEKKREFVERTTAIAQSYFDARNAIQRLWLIALDALEYVDSQEFVTKSPARDAKLELVTIAANAATLLSQPQHIAVVISDERPTEFDAPDFGQFGRLLERYLTEATPQIWSDPKNEKTISDRWTKDDFDVANDSLLAELLNKPTTTARSLRAIDLLLKSNAAKITPASLSIDLSTSELSSYGVSRGPLPLLDVDAAAGSVADFLERIPDLLSRFQAASAGGLERGRLPEGLYTLIDNYLLAQAGERDCHPDRKCSNTHSSEARRVLTDSLVHFAEKVLVIANNDVLIRDDNDGFDEDTEKYVRVLQATGNSILIQADEIRHREAHGRKLTNLVEAEKQALRRLFTRSPEEVFGNLMIGLKQDLVRATARLATASAAKSEADKEKAAAEAAQAVTAAAVAAATATHDTAKKDLGAVTTAVEGIVAAHRVLHGKHAAALKAAALTANPVTGTEMVQRLVDWLNGAYAAIPNALQNSDEPKQIQAAASYFTGLKPKVGHIKSGDAAKDFEAIVSLIDGHFALAQTEIEKAKAKLDEAKAALDGAKQNDADAKKAVAQKATMVKQAVTELANATSQKERLQTGIPKIEEFTRKVVDDIKGDRKKPKPSALYTLLRHKLEEARTDPAATAPSDAACKEPAEVCNGIAILGPLTPPMDPVEFDDTWVKNEDDGWPKRHPNALDVLDTMIAALRQEHIEAVREAGPERGRAPAIAAAIKAAYEHRSGLAYIRPSSAYLRSSYPSTSLQGDPSLGWQNMLFRHSHRSIPFAGEFIANRQYDPKERARLRITPEIDKQFWQTINSVRVAGAGTTNYVVAKDDIGNWYVKGYSADPDDIIKSARNLAMFSLGGQLDTDLLARLPDNQNGAPAPPTGVQRSSLEKVFDKHRTIYLERTQEDFDATKAMLDGGVRQKIDSAWGQDGKLASFIEELRSALTSTAASLTAANEEMGDGEETTEQGARIVSALRAAERFADALEANIRGRDLAQAEAAKVTEETADLEAARLALQTEEAALPDKELQRNRADTALSNLTQAEQPDAEAIREAREDRDTKQQAVDAQKTAIANARSTVASAESAVQEAMTAHTAKLQAIDAAVATAKGIVRSQVDALLKRRRQAVEEFERAIVFIGDAIGERQAESESDTQEVADAAAQAAENASSGP